MNGNRGSVRAKYRRYVVTVMAALMVVGLFGSAFGGPGLALAQSGSCAAGAVTPALTEGPYYKAGRRSGRRCWRRARRAQNLLSRDMCTTGIARL